MKMIPRLFLMASLAAIYPIFSGVLELFGITEDSISAADVEAFFDVIGAAVVFVPLDVFITILGAGVVWLTVQIHIAVVNFILRFVPFID
jgi:hypothetical protein